MDVIGNGVRFDSIPTSQSITVTYATQFDGQISILVNDVDTTDLFYTNTGSFTGAYEEASVNVALSEGDSLSIIRNADEDIAINIDFVTFNEEMVAGGTPTPRPTMEPDGLNKFEPAGEQVLMFIGQDNEGVGGNSSNTDATVWNDGYLDSTLVTPAGVTSYMTIGPNFGGANQDAPDGFLLGGVRNTAEYGAGPVCLQCYLDNSDFTGTDFAVHISIFYASPVGTSGEIAAGDWDDQIAELAEFLDNYRDIPFFIRPGYEFELQYRDAGVSAQDYVGAFQRIVDGFNNPSILNVDPPLTLDSFENIAFVYSSASVNTPFNAWEDYYPGNDYVDWVGYSHFFTGVPAAGLSSGVFDFARHTDRPIMIGEAAYVPQILSEENAEAQWNAYFQPLFDTVELAPQYVKAIAYINTDWTSQSLWTTEAPTTFGITDSRIQNSSTLINNWNNELADDKYILADDDIFSIINFIPPAP